MGAPSCWRGHRKCERQSLSVLVKDFTVTILHFTLYYGYYTARQQRVFFPSILVLMLYIVVGPFGFNASAVKQEDNVNKINK